MKKVSQMASGRMRRGLMLHHRLTWSQSRILLLVLTATFGVSTVSAQVTTPDDCFVYDAWDSNLGFREGSKRQDFIWNGSRLSVSHGYLCVGQYPGVPNQYPNSNIKCFDQDLNPVDEHFHMTGVNHIAVGKSDHLWATENRNIYIDHDLKKVLVTSVPSSIDVDGTTVNVTGSIQHMVIVSRRDSVTQPVEFNPPGTGGAFIDIPAVLIN